MVFDGPSREISSRYLGTECGPAVGGRQAMIRSVSKSLVEKTGVETGRAARDDEWGR